MKPNSGYLRANDKKTSDKHPNAKGSALIDGVEYWVSAWTNTGDDGKRYQSMSFETKDKQAAQGEAAASKPAQDDRPATAADENLPF
jgi:hypothetical protein